MPKTTTTSSRSKTSKTSSPEARPAPAQAASGSPVVISMGCPSGVGPEVTLAACLARSAPPALIVGDRGALESAAEALGVSRSRVDRIADYEGGPLLQGVRLTTPPHARLAASEREWGEPSAAAGRAQLAYVEEGYAWAKKLGVPLVTAPVSKEVIAHCGERRAKSFRGHTEWLEALDAASHSVMCFASPRLITSLVTTHIPIQKVPRALTEENVARSIIELVDLTLRLGKKTPQIAVCSLNPHAGEGELLGMEETRAILPGIERARRIVGRRAKLLGPIGAETAYRKGARGDYDAVVAMYHDQATIPMKLLDFGGAVNITQGLSVVRTSVDHGTAYDIAGRGLASAAGMKAAVEVAGRLGAHARRIALGSW